MAYGFSRIGVWGNNIRFFHWRSWWWPCHSLEDYFFIFHWSCFVCHLEIINYLRICWTWQSWTCPSCLTWIPILWTWLVWGYYILYCQWISWVQWCDIVLGDTELHFLALVKILYLFSAKAINWSAVISSPSLYWSFLDLMYLKNSSSEATW